MCLKTVDKETKKGNGVGYKVFDIDEWYHIFPQCQGDTRYKYGIWCEDRNKEDIVLPEGSYYKAGYHIYTTYKDAEQLSGWEETVRRVEYQDVVASGVQNGVSVIVARKMLIHTAKETKEKK